VLAGAPSAWLTYTLVRGEIADWYPFVGGSKLGYGGVLGRSVGLMLGFRSPAQCCSGSGTGARESEHPHLARAAGVTLRRPWSTAPSAS